MVFGNDRTIITNQFLEEGVWQWSNGDPWSYENWHAGEPNNVDNEVGIKKNRKVRSKQEMFFSHNLVRFRVKKNYKFRLLLNDIRL